MLEKQAFQTFFVIFLDVYNTRETQVCFNKIVKRTTT